MLAGCAIGKDPRDPFEGFNRAMYSVNDKVDRYALKPTAEVYRDTVPSFVQTGVYNFFGNLGDVWTAVNNLLQGKIGHGVSDVMRVAVNTVLGLGGVLDIASEAGMPKHKQDFGATLGVWGVGSGPYVVLPFFGPSTLRDTVALPLDMKADIWGEVTPVWQRNTGRVLRVVDLRAGVLDAVNLIEEAALDPYEFVRDGFLQRRASKINEGAASAMPREEPVSKQPVTPVSSLLHPEPRQSVIVESVLMPPVVAEGIRLRYSRAVIQNEQSRQPPS
ncbi:MAG: VacJ family lipoprotein [Lacisediminimonas sp.]|nr:VacJ family lipoprotein [Lacisediminimonas sp.]MDO8301507.1 VacJ family lipoprotein [Lacisediminimonas sp.]MDO9217524.1 VacJ family lipoprotein [Lacisediminimonas sp.]